MDTKSVAIQLRTLASDPENQQYIVREGGCMKGLMGFLRSGSEEVLIISLQALEFLSSHPNNKELLSKEPGLLTKLAELTKDDNPLVAKISSTVLDNITSFINKEPSPTSQFKPKSLFNVPLQVPSMTSQAHADAVQRALLEVSGVVSITVDVQCKEVIVYTRAEEKHVVDMLIAAVKSAGFEAHAGQGQDPSVVAPEEVSPLKPSKPAYASNKTKSVPGYLDAPSKAPAKASSSATPAYLPSKFGSGIGGVAYANKPSYLSSGFTNVKRGSVTEYAGLHDNSLEARLRRQRKKLAEKKKKETNVKSFLGSVSSYFW